MSRNAIGSSRQTPRTSEHQQAPAPNKRPHDDGQIHLPCPSWCVSHSDADEGTRDAFRVHHGDTFRSGDRAVRLLRTDVAYTGRPGPVNVLLDDTEVTAVEAEDLADLLTTAARAASGPEVERHEAWCDPARHARVALESLGGRQECLGRDLFVKVEAARREVAGYWTQRPNRTAYFAAEWDFKTGDLALADLKSLHKLLTQATPAEIAQIGQLLSAAISDYEDGFRAEAAS